MARLERLAGGCSVPPVLPRDLARRRSGALLKVGLAGRCTLLPNALTRPLVLSAALLVCSAVGGAAHAQALPALTAPVNDFAHVIDAASANALDQRIRALEAATHDTVIVATVDTVAPFGSIEEYATKLFEHAGIGQKGHDNGLLVLVAVKDHKVRIEVGYALEEFVTDGFAGETIRELMLPEFRQGHYGAGILAGTTHVITRVADRRGVTLTDVPRADLHQDETSFPPILIPILIIVVLSVLRMAARHGGGPGGGLIGGPRIGPWSGWGGGVGGFGGGGFGGGGGGGFGGFGGGMSGGGGASGSW